MTKDKNEISVPALSSVRLTTYLVDLTDSVPVTQANIVSATLTITNESAGTTAAPVTLDKTLVILDTPLTSASGRPFNFAHVTTAASFPDTESRYVIIADFDYGSGVKVKERWIVNTY